VFYATVETANCENVECLTTNTEVVSAFGDFIMCSKVTEVLDEIKEEVEAPDPSSRTVASMIKEEGALDAIEVFLGNATAQWVNAEEVRDEIEEEMKEAVRPTGNETLGELIAEEEAVAIMEEFFDESNREEIEQDMKNEIDHLLVPTPKETLGELIQDKQNVETLSSLNLDLDSKIDLKQIEEVIDEDIQEELIQEIEQDIEEGQETLNDVFRKEGVVDFVEEFADVSLNDAHDVVSQEAAKIINSEIQTIIGQSTDIEEEEHALELLETVVGDQDRVENVLYHIRGGPSSSGSNVKVNSSDPLTIGMLLLFLVFVVYALYRFCRSRQPRRPYRTGRKTTSKSRYTDTPRNEAEHEEIPLNEKPSFPTR
jgi:hypothetical protein